MQKRDRFKTICIHLLFASAFSVDEEEPRSKLKGSAESLFKESLESNTLSSTSDVTKVDDGQNVGLDNKLETKKLPASPSIHSPQQEYYIPGQGSLNSSPKRIYDAETGLTYIDIASSTDEIKASPGLPESSADDPDDGLTFIDCLPIGSPITYPGMHSNTTSQAAIPCRSPDMGLVYLNGCALSAEVSDFLCVMSCHMPHLAENMARDRVRITRSSYILRVDIFTVAARRKKAVRRTSPS